MMTAERFLAEYMGRFEPDCRLHDLGVQYHHRCDAFDDDHLTGPVIRGDVMPANNRERALMERNAAEVRRHVIFLGEQMGYTRKQVEESIKSAAKNSR